MNQSEFTASKLRLLLISVNVVLIAAIATGFYFAQDYLRTQADYVKDYAAKNTLVVLSPAATQKLKDSLAGKELIATKIDSVFATQDNYNAAAINSLSTYATKTGLVVESTSFDSVNNANPDTKLATVTLKSPLSYDSFIKFLKYIENSTPKMQIEEISVSRPQGSESGSIKVDKLVVGIYVK